eukprot:scaffold8740_cov113-Cylindrotheca_fusiformis.AAC.10
MASCRVVLEGFIGLGSRCNSPPWKLLNIANDKQLILGKPVDLPSFKMLRPRKWNSNALQFCCPNTDLECVTCSG